MLQKWSNKVYQAVYNITREGGFTVYRLEPGSLVLVPDPSGILNSEIGSNQLKGDTQCQDSTQVNGHLTR